MAVGTHGLWMDGVKIMKINGIGQVSKETVLSILTKDGMDAIESGEMTIEEVAEMYKLEQVKKASKIGRCGDTFSANYRRIPETLKEKLSPAELGELVDAFYHCYGDGKNEKNENR